MKKEYHSNCFVCKSLHIKEIKGYEKHQLMKCKSCGFVFMKQIPTIKELNEWYSSYSYDQAGYLSPVTIISYHKLLDEFEGFRKSNKILDVGCGRGYFLEEAKKRGWEVYGTEYSETAVQICRSKDINMKLGKLDPLDFGNINFDVITSFEVIEHINDPNEELRSINKLLRKDGLFYCTTPNFNSLLRFYLKDKYNVIEYPEHLSYYTRSTLNKVITKNNFNAYKFLSTGFSISRLKRSKGNSTETLNAPSSSDEVLRQNIEKKWYLALAKKIVNFALTFTNTGMALKGYYIKK